MKIASAGAFVLACLLAALPAAPRASASASPEPDWKRPGERENSMVRTALVKGHLYQIQQYLDEGMDPNARFEGAGSLTPLALAVLVQRADGLKLLLDAGADPGLLGVAEVDDRGRRRQVETYSPLMYAAAVGSAEIASGLIARGADVNQAGAAGVTAVVVSALFDTEEVMKLLLQKGAKVDAALEDSTDLPALDFPGLERRASPRGEQRLGRGFAAPAGATALWFAAAAGSPKTAALLVAAQADRTVSARCTGFAKVPAGEEECTPARLAELLGRTDVAALLGPSGVAAPAQIQARTVTREDREDLWKRLRLLAESDDAEGLRPYLAGGLDPDGLHDPGQSLTLLTLAASSKAEKVTALLIEKGADPDKPGTRESGKRVVPYRTPLMMAASGCPACVGHLLRAGADVSLVGDEGVPALFFAARSGPPEVLAALLEAGAGLDTRLEPARPEVPFAQGATPLWTAAAAGNAAAARLLVARGADLEAQAPCTVDAKGNASGPDCTPRQAAERYQRREVIAALDAAGAGVTQKTVEADLLAPGLERAVFHERLAALVRRGEPQRLAELLDRGLDPDTLVDDGGLVPLVSLAVLAHRDATLAILLRRGADCRRMSLGRPDKAAMTGLLTGGERLEGRGDLVPAYSPLMYAVAGGTRASFELLLKAGADVNALGIGDLTALMRAAERNEGAIVARLLASGAQIGARVDNREHDQRVAPHRASALWLACKAGALEAVQALLAAGADPQAPAECRSRKAGPGEKDCDCRRIAELSGKPGIVALVDRSLAAPAPKAGP